MRNITVGDLGGEESKDVRGDNYNTFFNIGVARSYLSI